MEARMQQRLDGMEDSAPSTEVAVRSCGEVTKAVTGADVVAAVVDTMRLHDVPIPGSFKARIGKHAKELLADGYDADTVLTAALIAIRRGEPGAVPGIALDLKLATSGQHMTRQDSRREVATVKATLDPVKRGFSEALDRIYQEKAERRSRQHGG